MPALTTSIYIVLEVLGSTLSQEKDRRHKVWKEVSHDSWPGSGLG